MKLGRPNNSPYFSILAGALAGILLSASISVWATTIGNDVSVTGTLSSTGAFSVTSTAATSTISTGGLTVGTSQFVVQQTSGNVGLGTTGPLSKLDVSGGVAIGSYAGSIVAPSNGLILSGNLGIGTTTPGTPLGVTGVVVFTGNLTLPSFAATSTSATSTLSTGGFAIGTNQFIVQQNSGNVGISTTSPGTPLAVTGAGVFTGLLTVPSFNATSTSATSTFSTGGLNIGSGQFLVQQNSGNVGVGTSSPGTPLGVTGAAVITGNLTLPSFSATSTAATSTLSTGGLTVGTNQFVVQQNSGKVGILTTTPNTPFEVVGTASSTNLVVGGGTAIIANYSASASLDFPVIGANSCQALTITVTGATDGDVVSLGVPTALANASSTFALTGWVSAANTVSVRVCQVAGVASSDPAAATVRAEVRRY